MFTICVLECINQNCSVCKCKDSHNFWPCRTLLQSTSCLQSWVQGELWADFTGGSGRHKWLSGHFSPLWDGLWSCWGISGLFITCASVTRYPLVHWKLALHLQRAVPEGPASHVQFESCSLAFCSGWMHMHFGVNWDFFSERMLFPFPKCDKVLRKEGRFSWRSLRE